MASREFVLEPKYLPYAPGSTEHAFQQEIANVRDLREDCLIVTAPTGAGKTHALANLSKSSMGIFAPRLLIISPTNALSSQISHDLKIANSGLKIGRWAAEEFDTYGVLRGLEMINQSQVQETIISNPDLLHLFVQNFYSWRYGNNSKQTHRTFEDAMYRFGVHVFDEYHSYDERMLASVISYMLKARALPACKHHYVFLSATPNPGLLAILSGFGFTFKSLEEKESIAPMENSRLIKNRLEVEVTTGSVKDHLGMLPRPGQNAPRTLIVFDTFASQHLTLNEVLEIGYSLDSNGGVVSMTGRETKSDQGQAEWEHAAIIMATKKADLGLNIDTLQLLIMEPGWYISDFHQRFGRAGRSAPGKVIIVLPEEAKGLLPMDLPSGQPGLDALMAKVTTVRPFSNDRVMMYVGYQLAATEYFTTKAGLKEVLYEIPLPPKAAAARAILRRGKMLPEEFDSHFRPNAEKLVHKLMVSFSLLRGQSLEVNCAYQRPKGELRTKESLLYILSRTDHIKEKRNGASLYLIKGFREKPNDIIVDYPGLTNPIAVAVPGGKLTREVFMRYVDALIEDLEVKTIEGEAGPGLRAYGDVLRTIAPDQLAPLEVQIDDGFL